MGRVLGGAASGVDAEAGFDDVVFVGSISAWDKVQVDDVFSRFALFFFFGCLADVVNGDASQVSHSVADDGGAAGNQTLTFPLKGPEQQVKSQFWGADCQGNELNQAAACADEQNGGSGQDSLKRSDHRRPHRVCSLDYGVEHDLSVRLQHIGHLFRQARPGREARKADGEDGALGDNPEHLEDHDGRFHD